MHRNSTHPYCYNLLQPSLTSVVFESMQAFPAAAQRVMNFDTDLCDGGALGALLLSHWPELGPLATQLTLAPPHQTAAQYNAGTVVKMMEELQLPWQLQV